MKKEIPIICFFNVEPQVKTFHLLSSFIGWERSKVIVEKYDKKNLFPMLLKCYYHLHSLVGSGRGVVDQRVEMDRNLDIFGMITNISEWTTKLVNRELLIFRCYQLDVKNVKCLQGWEKHESVFLTIHFCAKQILGIVGSQIEIEIIFLLTRIL